VSLAKKGLRKISISNTFYCWTVSPDDEPGLGIIVEREADPCQRLTCYVKHGTIIFSGYVKKVIQYALKQGWKPDQKRPPFRCDYHESENEFLGSQNASE
jgi:hypothetical protein